MNISEAVDFLNFWVGKETGSYYTVAEAVEIIDRGQMSLYSDLQPHYATSQRVKDALSPFVDQFDFTPAETVLGLLTIPANLNPLNLTEIMITYALGSATEYEGVSVVNADERAKRLKSRVRPVTVTSPIAESVGKLVFQLWPKTTYTGQATFLRRPVKPVMAYSVVSGRVIVYNPVGSTQLEWTEQYHNMVLIKALNSLGINLSDADIMNWAQQKSAQNAQNTNRT